MSGPPSPWSPPPPPKPEPARRIYRRPLDRRQWSWLLLVLFAVGAGLWAMTEVMPDQAAFDGDWSQAAQWALLATIVGSGLVRLRMRPHEALRNILLWIAIAAALGLGYAAWTQAKAPPHNGPPPVQVVPRLPGPAPQQVRLDGPPPFSPVIARRL
ncbi:MAG TPA: hypothetical protein VMU59_00990 [Caulobacteraceae bacterium]|nr:hypothetical protein [Caulobacteraceae bacterium]